ncbi:MAG: hypothetical protein RBR37_07605 [Advenella sp.]|nr:hypothetical protein [Advenella sp.]
MTQPTQAHQGLTFAAISYEIMQRVYKEGKQLNKSPEEISADIRKAYPWAVRKGNCYNKWLQVRTEFFTKHNLPGLYSRRTSLDQLATVVQNIER